MFLPIALHLSLGVLGHCRHSCSLLYFVYHAAALSQFSGSTYIVWSYTCVLIPHGVLLHLQTLTDAVSHGHRHPSLSGSKDLTFPPLFICTL